MKANKTPGIVTTPIVKMLTIATGRFPTMPYKVCKDDSPWNMSAGNDFTTDQLKILSGRAEVA